mgnify:CR=1 FL=1
MGQGFFLRPCPLFLAVLPAPAYLCLSTEQVRHLLFPLDFDFFHLKPDHRVKPEKLTGIHLANLRVIAPANTRQGVAQALKQVVAQVRLRALVNAISGGNGLHGLFRKTSQGRKYKLNFERKRPVLKINAISSMIAITPRETMFAKATVGSIHKQINPELLSVPVFRAKNCNLLRKIVSELLLIVFALHKQNGG